MSHLAKPDEDDDYILRHGQARFQAFSSDQSYSSDSGVSLTRTVAVASPEATRGSLRRDYSHNLSQNLRSGPQTPTEERRNNLQGGRDSVASKRIPMRQNDEPNDSGRNTLRRAAGSANGQGKSKDYSAGGSNANGNVNSNNFTDFFGWDVFQIVMHNPTTAHRLLKFCQSRACGETMEFLQKVSNVPYDV